MKLPLPLTLVFFLHLLTAAPIPSKYRSILSSDYLYYASAACQPSRRITFTSKPNTPPKTLSNPHYSSHQLFSPSSSSASAYRAAEQALNNLPRTPPKQLERNQALSAKVPLESSYLLSLANTATTLEQQDRVRTISATDALAAKPTSALPYLRKEDAKRYWATLRSGSSSGEIEGHDEIVASDRLIVPESTRMYADGFGTEGFCSREPIRTYSDILVVGIVVLALVAMVAWEAAERIGDIFVAYGRRRLCGKVYSEDEETVESTKKRFFLCRPPKPRSKITVNEHGDKGQKSGIQAKVEAKVSAASLN